MSRFNDIIENYNELRARVNWFNKFYPSDGKTLAHIQKIYSCHTFIALSLRFPGVSRFLYIGRGGGFEGILPSYKTIPSPLRIIDRYLEYLRKYLVGAYLHPLILAEGDRVLFLPYSNLNRKSLFAIFYKGRQMYFANCHHQGENVYKFFASWLKVENDEVHMTYDELFDFCKEQFKSVGARFDIEKHDDVKLSDEDIIQDYFDDLKNGQVIITNKERKFLERKIKNIESDLSRAKVCTDLKRTIENPAFAFTDDYEQLICGIKFKMPSSLSHFQKMNVVYDKIKSLKRGVDILEKRLTDTRSLLLKKMSGQKLDLYRLPEKIISPVYAQVHDKKSKIKKDEQSGIEIFEYQGLKFGIGLTSNGNDNLRNSFAAKNDIWFHLDGMHSAHLIIKRTDLIGLDEMSFRVIGSAIRDYTKLDILQIPVIYTQVKNLKGIKGTPGSVIYKKVKHLVVQYLSDWKAIISSD